MFANGGTCCLYSIGCLDVHLPDFSTFVVYSAGGSGLEGSVWQTSAICIAAERAETQPLLLTTRTRRQEAPTLTPAPHMCLDLALRPEGLLRLYRNRSSGRTVQPPYGDVF